MHVAAEKGHSDVVPLLPKCCKSTCYECLDALAGAMATREVVHYGALATPVLKLISKQADLDMGVY